jgi:hypothetical protein
MDHCLVHFNRDHLSSEGFRQLSRFGSRLYRCENSVRPGTSICAFNTVPLSLSVM